MMLSTGGGGGVKECSACPCSPSRVRAQVPQPPLPAQPATCDGIGPNPVGTRRVQNPKGKKKWGRGEKGEMDGVEDFQESRCKSFFGEGFFFFFF